NNLTTNLRNSFAGMAPENWIRLVIIVGTYMLIRPYLLKLGAKTQMKQHEKEAAETKAAAIEQAKMSPNELRGHKIAGIPEDSDEEEVAQAESTSADWGKKARKRQRQMIKKILDAEEKRLQDLQEDDEDKDIQEFLV
ncbi:protein trafficking Pga2, partial [Coniella lustricola]